MMPISLGCCEVKCDQMRVALAPRKPRKQRLPDNLLFSLPMCDFQGFIFVPASCLDPGLTQVVFVLRMTS